MTLISSITKSILLKIRFNKRISIKLYKHLSFFCHMNIDKNSYISAKKGLMLENNAWLIAHNGGKIYIGNNVSFNKNTICCSHEKITIESNTSIGPNVCIYDHDHKFNSNGKILGFRTSEVIIGENVWIGANVTILRGTVIGNNSIIGAGSVIKGEIPSNSIVYNDKNLVVKKLK